MYDDENENDVERFFATEHKHEEENQQQQQQQQQKPSKKRKQKHPKPADDKENQQKQKAEAEQDLRKRARFYCTCPQQWKAVSHYNEKRLEEFISEKVFEQNQALAQTVFDGAHKILAGVLDKISQGGGFVEEQILADVTLRQSIEQEGADFVFLIQNKARILFLTLLDTVNGKRTQHKLAAAGRGGGVVVEQQEEEVAQSGDFAAADSEEQQALQEKDEGADGLN